MALDSPLPRLVSQTDEIFRGQMPLPPELFLEGEPISDIWAPDFTPAGKLVNLGIWVGQPGAIAVHGYPVDEFFTVLEGHLRLENEDGSAIEVGPGEAAIVPQGWKGVWRTLKVTLKTFASFA